MSDCFLQNELNLSVRHFYMPIDLGMICYGQFMSDRVFTRQGFERPVAEMSPIITDNSARGTEM